MRKYDLLILGPATRDVNIDYTGAEDRSTGGAVTYCTYHGRNSASGKRQDAYSIKKDDAYEERVFYGGP